MPAKPDVMETCDWCKSEFELKDGILGSPDDHCGPQTVLLAMCPACIKAWNQPHDRKLSNGMIKDTLTGEVREPIERRDEYER